MTDSSGLQLTELLSGIDVGVDFTQAGLTKTIRENLDRVMFGGLDREGFAERVFDFGDLSRLPIAHLANHCVMMPPSIVTRLIADGKPAIEMLLKNMLHGYGHSEAAAICAKSLDLNPTRDSEHLHALLLEHPDLFRACLAGDIKTSRHLTRTVSQSIISAAAQSNKLMLVYYCALQLQIMTAHWKAVDDYRVGVANKSGAITKQTMGKTLNDQVSLLDAIDKVLFVLENDKLPVGNIPNLISNLEEKAEGIKAQLGDGVAKRLFSELQSIGPELKGIVVRARGILAGSKVSWSEKRILAANAFDDDTAGVKIAFASLRLVSLTHQVEQIVDTFMKRPKVDFKPWLRGRLTGRSGAAAILTFVHRTVGLEEPHAGSANINGREIKLSSQIATFKLENKSPGEDTLRAALARADDWKRLRKQMKFPALVGLQLFDIVPDYYFVFDVALPPIRKKAKLGRKGYAQAIHQPSPVYRAPKRAPRP